MIDSVAQYAIADESDTIPATSAVDLDTDKAIQAIIRSAVFEDVTMFTIAYVNLSKAYVCCSCVPSVYLYFHPAIG